MPGTISFRPIEANLTHDTNWLGRMDPYCMFTLGTQKARSQVCKHGSTRPHWDDVVTLQALDVPSVVSLEILNKDKLRPDASIAAAVIDLTELNTLGSVSKWYPVYHHKKLAGEVLIEAVYQPEQIITQTVVPTTTVVETVTMVPTQTLNQEVPFETFGQQPLVGQTITQVTNLGGLPVDQGFNTVQPVVPIQGENFGLIGNQFESGLPTTQTLGGLPQGQFIEGQNLGLINNTNPGLLASKTSLLGPQGGFPHGHRLLGGATNAGYSVRPGYTLGTVEPNPTCQSNVDTNGGGFFNKPGRERRAEPYTLSNPGTYGIPHGDTVDTTGHLQPNVLFDRPAPIGQINQPGITGYPDGFNHGAGAIPPRNLNQDSFPLRDKI